MHTFTFAATCFSCRILSPKLIATGHRFFLLVVWDLQTGQQLRVFDDHAQDVVDIVVYENTLISAGGLIKFHDMTTWACVRTIDVECKALRLCVSGNKLYVVIGDKGVDVFDIKTGATLGSVLKMTDDITGMSVC